MSRHKRIALSLNVFLSFLAGNLTLYFGADSAVSCRASAKEAPAESALQQPFLAASPQALIAAASKTDTDLGTADIEVLLDEGRYRIDAQDRVTEIDRQIYRCITQDALEQHGIVQAIWSPWYQDRPTISARVISPDGQAHVLNPNTLEEIRIPSGQENVFTDAKLLRAPLPGLTAGCIVETQVIVKEHAPFSTAGSSGAFQLGSLLAPTRLVHVVIEAPVTASLNYRVLRSDQPVVVKKSEDKQVVELAMGPVPPLIKQYEAHLPHDLAQVPMIRFSTVRSWRKVASEYATIVQRQLVDQNLGDVVRTAIGVNSSKSELEKQQITALLLAHIRRTTRYTSISFGQAAIIPRKPCETLQRRYGDCKDLSTLLVGMLRAVGIKADIALVQVGSEMDPIPNLPQLSAFNHAIVYVPGATPMWVDPTDRFTPLGEVPASIQGRSALIANHTTRDLVRIPRSSASANRMVRSYVVTLSESSEAAVATNTTCHGTFAAHMRASFASCDRKTQRDWLRHQGKSSLGTDQLTDFSYSPPEDLNAPFNLDTTFTNAQIAKVRHPEAGVSVSLTEAFNWLPFDLVGYLDTSQVVFSEDETETGKQRMGPLSLPFPFQHELKYRLVPPPGYVPIQLPDDFSICSGPATFAVTYRQEDDHSVRIRASFDSGAGSLTAEEVRELRRQVESLGQGKGYQGWRILIRFEHTAGKYLEAGRLQEAIQAYHQLCQRYTDSPACHARLAQAALQLGLGDLARQHARRAAELAPQEFHSHYVLGQVLAHNRIGQYLAPGFDREEGLSAYRRALKLNPDDARLQWEYGLLLESHEWGVRDADPEDVRAATAEFYKVYHESKDDELLDGLVTSLCTTGKHQEARKLLEDANPSATRDLLLLAVIATNDGVEACGHRATTLWPASEQRQTGLLQLLAVLDSMREYKTAANLARHQAESSTQQQLLLQYANNFDVRSRYVPDEPFEEIPTGLVKSLLAHALVHGCASSRLERFFVDIPKQENYSLAVELPPWLELFRNRSLESSHSPQRMADTVTEFTCQVTGKGTDYFRVEVQHKMYPEMSWSALVVRHEHTLRLCCKGINDSCIGQRALELLTDGRQDDARRWLEWVYERQLRDLGWFDQFQGSPFARLWLAAGKHDQDLELAAAALAAASDSAPKCIAILSAGRGELAPIQQLQVDRALASGYDRLGNDQELVKLTRTICETHPRALEPALFQLRALSRIQDIAAIQQFVDQHAGNDELKVWGQLMLAATLTATGNTEQAADLLNELRQRQERLGGYLLTEVVWLSLFQDPLPAGTVALAAESLKQADLAGLEDRVEAERRSQALYTLALIENGQLAAAIQALHSITAVDAESRPDRLDHYVLGRIAEACGFPEQAISHFKQVAPFESRQPNSLFDLAQQRLAPLDDKLRKYGKVADSR